MSLHIGWVSLASFSMRKHRKIAKSLRRSDLGCKGRHRFIGAPPILLGTLQFWGIEIKTQRCLPERQQAQRPISFPNHLWRTVSNHKTVTSTIPKWIDVIIQMRACDATYILTSFSLSWHLLKVPFHQTPEGPLRTLKQAQHQGSVKLLSPCSACWCSAGSPRWSLDRSNKKETERGCSLQINRNRASQSWAKVFWNGPWNQFRWDAGRCVAVTVSVKLVWWSGWFSRCFHPSWKFFCAKPKPNGPLTPVPARAQIYILPRAEDVLDARRDHFFCELLVLMQVQKYCQRSHRSLPLCWMNLLLVRVPWPWGMRWQFLVMTSCNSPLSMINTTTTTTTTTTTNNNNNNNNNNTTKKRIFKLEQISLFSAASRAKDTSWCKASKAAFCKPQCWGARFASNTSVSVELAYPCI